MPTHAGPNSSADNSIVFSYDTGDTSNSYRGEPTVNIAADLGLVSVALSSITYIGIENGWKKYGLSGTWSSGTYPYAIALNPVTFTGGLPYCVRATVKTNVPDKFNYFGAEGISYVNEPKNYEGTLTSTLNPDGSYTVTRYNFAYTNTTAQAGYLYTNPVNGAVFNPSTDFVWIKEYQAEQKDHPTQFVNGTRSATQGLLPLLGNTSINLSNVSFDSNAQIVFDGTDDYIVTTTSIPCNFGTGDFTIEVMIYPQSFISYTHMVALPDQNTFALKADIGNGIIYYYDPSFTTYGSTSGWTLTLNQWNHVVLVRSGNVAYAYLNGASKGSKTGFNTNLSSTQIVNIGNGGTLEHTPKKINLVKIYNTALTADQVQQNYRQYKSRFNLS